MKAYKIGVLSDTHIPDRAVALDSSLIPALKAEKVDVIFHAGDVSVQRVLSELDLIAPLIAVRGNRDFLIRKNIPKIRVIEKFGVTIALMHGHIDLKTYWLEKIQYLVTGYQRSRYLPRLRRAAPEALVYVFGHSHRAENFWQDGKYFFNPGSMSVGDTPEFKRSWGLLQVFEDGRVAGEIRYM
ncbi:MAG: YfcE family phosphodiesterase [Chloroflexi bacterium]|nr:YfcE family phosphodiesterase [Chloroflexota bacterium]